MAGTFEMIGYRIYLLDGASAFIDSIDLRCASDQEAILELRKFAPQAARLELWEGRRLVCRFGGTAPPDPGDGDYAA